MGRYLLQDALGWRRYAISSTTRYRQFFSVPYSNGGSSREQTVWRLLQSKIVGIDGRCDENLFSGTIVQPFVLQGHLPHNFPNCDRLERRQQPRADWVWLAQPQVGDIWEAEPEKLAFKGSESQLLRNCEAIASYKEALPRRHKLSSPILGIKKATVLMTIACAQNRDNQILTDVYGYQQIFAFRTK